MRDEFDKIQKNIFKHNISILLRFFLVAAFVVHIGILGDLIVNNLYIGIGSFLFAVFLLSAFIFEFKRYNRQLKPFIFNISSRPDNLYYIRKIFSARSRGHGGRVLFYLRGRMNFKKAFSVENRFTFIRYKNWFIYENFAIKKGIFFILFKYVEIEYYDTHNNYWAFRKWYSANKNGSRNLRSDKNFALSINLFNAKPLVIRVYGVKRPRFDNINLKSTNIKQSEPYYILQENLDIYRFCNRGEINMPETSGIYAWINIYTKEIVYIGKTNNFNRRYNEHVYEITIDSGTQKYNRMQEKKIRDFGMVILYSDVKVPRKLLRRYENHYYIEAGEKRLWNYASPMQIEKFFS